MKLKPCPFCGSEAVGLRVDEEGARVRCIDCFAMGPPFGRMAQASAVAAWERRTPSHPMKKGKR